VHVCNGDGSALSSGTTGRNIFGVNNLMSVINSQVGLRDNVDCSSQCHDGPMGEIRLHRCGLGSQEKSWKYIGLYMVDQGQHAEDTNQIVQRPSVKRRKQSKTAVCQGNTLLSTLREADQTQWMTKAIRSMVSPTVKRIRT
jgi:hypothetical protein